MVLIHNLTLLLQLVVEKEEWKAFLRLLGVMAVLVVVALVAQAFRQED
jgi:hypothetical protein